MGGSRNPRRDRITKRLADLAVSIWPNRRGKLRFPDHSHKIWFDALERQVSNLHVQQEGLDFHEAAASICPGPRFLAEAFVKPFLSILLGGTGLARSQRRNALSPVASCVGQVGKSEGSFLNLLTKSATVIAM
jgi:hypothetical protein